MPTGVPLWYTPGVAVQTMSAGTSLAHMAGVSSSPTSRGRSATVTTRRAEIDALDPWFHTGKLDAEAAAPDHVPSDCPRQLLSRFSHDLPDALCHPLLVLDVLRQTVCEPDPHADLAPLAGLADRAALPGSRIP